MRLRASPLRQHSTRASAVIRDRKRKSAAAEVRARWISDGRRCSGCGMRVEVVDCAHVFGKGSRKAGIPEWVASLPELQAPLCTFASWDSERLGCHQLVDRGMRPGLLLQLRWQAVERFATWLDPRMTIGLDADADPLSVMRALIRMAEIEHPDKVEAAQR